MFDEVLITPHLDDASKTMQWRNGLRYDPLAKDAKGWTYWDVMMAPIAQSIEAVYTRPGKRVTLALQGEMGATVFFAPGSYRKLVDRIRADYKGPAKLDVALLFNGGFVPGVVTRGPDPVKKPAGAPPADADAALSSVWGQLKPLDSWPDSAKLRAGLPDARKLLQSVDVIGISCYPRVSVNPKAAEIEVCATRVDEELAAMSFDLKRWAGEPGKRLILNELGLGGGTHPCKGVPATSRTEAGNFGWMATGYPWTKETDPWSIPEMRQYRRDWHAAALQLLQSGGVRYPIKGAYLWSILSHDPQVGCVLIGGGGQGRGATVWLLQGRPL